VFTIRGHPLTVFKKLLVPLDGTPQSAAALPLARTIADAADATLLLLRVTEEADRSGEPERYLDVIARELPGRHVETIVRRGRAADAIVAIARDLNADAIVMATHGRVGVERMVSGSVSERVVTHSPVPVALVRPGGKRVTHVRTLLVPTDGTAGAALALGTAIGLARATGARLVLVEAIEPIPLWVYGSDYGAAPTYIDPDWEDEAVSAAETYIRGLVSRLQSAGVKAEGHAVKGKAVATIEAVADEADADLIVMSSHAHTGPARTLVGSTADALVRTAKRPVLLIRRGSGAADYETARTIDATPIASTAG
jgi:nucleotide-binding universal stress UspA family protein